MAVQFQINVPDVYQHVCDVSPGFFSFVRIVNERTLDRHRAAHGDARTHGNHVIDVDAHLKYEHHLVDIVGRKANLLSVCDL